MKSTRVIIYTKDVQRITGKSAQYCRRLLKRIKTIKAKAEHQNVNIHDLSDYLGISVELVQQQIVD